MMGARVFVTMIFLATGAMFLASTMLFVQEFQGEHLHALLMMHSHLFVFFPILGLLALAAFWLPAIVFTHMYWNHVRGGKFKFFLGTLGVLLLTGYFSYSLTYESNHSIWELTPRLLAQDRAETVNCPGRAQSCVRAPILDSLSRLREEASQRAGLSPFARSCKLDPLVEVPLTFKVERFCFPALEMLDGEKCCAVQARFGSVLNQRWQQVGNRSVSQEFDLIALPVKTFFIIVVLVIGFLLYIRRGMLEQHYSNLAPAIERSMFIGALAMLPWPIMDYAHLQAMQALTGRWSSSPEVRLSLVIAPWTLILGLYFLARLKGRIERLGQLAGGVVSLIAVLRYEQISDWGVRTLGIGAPVETIALHAVLAIIGFAFLRFGAAAFRSKNAAVAE